ncbi:MAG: lysophospholipase [Bacteroidales bacterium]|nr:lysophospholipase [Bacteroidales bacterium]
MNKSEYKLKASDETQIHVYECLPDNPADVKACLQIAHGMAEHAKRYDDFASFLNKHGFAVYANDHRGHGKTAGSIENLGYFADEKGFEKVVDDMRVLTDKIKSEFPDKPVFLLGHSMGSFLSRFYAIEDASKINGLILSGTAGDPGMLGQIGKLLSNLIAAVSGKKSQTPLMTSLSFGAYNKQFKPNRTDFDWLSRDNEQVDKYVNDPYCGTVFTAGFYKDMLGGLLYVNQNQAIKKMRKDLPVLLISGDKDPVSENGKGVKEVYEKMNKAGLNDVEMKLYPDARHEILNEINKDEVYNDVLNWITQRIS